MKASNGALINIDADAEKYGSEMQKSGILASPR